MKLPILPVGHVSVMRAEVATGILVDHDNTRIQLDQNNSLKNYCQIFDNIERARTEIWLSIGQDINYEFIVYDHEGNFIERIGSPHWPIYRRKFNLDDIIIQEIEPQKRGIARLMASFTQFFKKLRKK